jgi:hypothetical protein
VSHPFAPTEIPSLDHPTTPQDKFSHAPSSTEILIPESPFLESIPNYFQYENSLWSVKIALPLALILQTTGHFLVLRVWKRRKRHSDSLVLVLNYIAADTVFVVYLVVVFSLTVSSCTPVQILYCISISLPIFAVSLITLKRFIRVLKPLRCSYIITRNKELVLVAVSWSTVITIALLILFEWCEFRINNDIDYCYYSTADRGACRFYIGLQLVVYFVTPLISVLVMYGMMLRESRRAFQRNAFVSFINMNRL